MKKIQTPTGTYDILPQEQKFWRFLVTKLEKRFQAFGLNKIETPIFEYKSVFTQGLGQTTDIIEKEMFEVKRANAENLPNLETEKEPLMLRPEMTASIVRSYIENGMQTWPQPVKLYYISQVFRYERPQKGRFRQFWQAGTEIIGDENPLTDSVAILLLWQIFNDLGLKDDIVIDINSIGCKTCRNRYKKKLVEYFKSYEQMLCPNCIKRLANNPLRLLDCKEEKCQKIASGAPQIIDFLCLDCKNHFTKVLEYLDDLNIAYDLNPKLVRGLDYYSRTVFEIREKNDVNRQAALGGGGRYDYLIETFGGKSTPAIGWAIGIERVIEKLKQKEIKVDKMPAIDLLIIQIGEKARKKALPLVATLNDLGYNASCVLGKDSLKAQLKAADKMNARFALIIGQREALDNTVIIKNMEDAAQETITLNRLEKYLEKKFSK